MSGSGYTAFARVGSRRVAFVESNPGRGAWISDGTAAGTVPIQGSPSGGGIELLSGGRVFGIADDGCQGSEPWVLDPGATAQPLPQWR